MSRFKKNLCRKLCSKDLASLLQGWDTSNRAWQRLLWDNVCLNVTNSFSSDMMVTRDGCEEQEGWCTKNWNLQMDVRIIESFSKLERRLRAVMPLSRITNLFRRRIASQICTKMEHDFERSPTGFSTGRTDISQFSGKYCKSNYSTEWLNRYAIQ